MYERPRERGSLNWTGGSGMTATSVTGPWNPNNRLTEKTFAKLGQRRNDLLGVTLLTRRRKGRAPPLQWWIYLRERPHNARIAVHV